MRAGGVWWERHVRSRFLMDWNAVTLKTFDPGPPKTSFLWKECCFVSPPFFCSLPSRPLSHETVKALSFLHGLCCIAWNLISMCTLCPIHVLLCCYVASLQLCDVTADECLMLMLSIMPARLDLVLLLFHPIHSWNPEHRIISGFWFKKRKNRWPWP